MDQELQVHQEEKLTRNFCKLKMQFFKNYSKVKKVRKILIYLSILLKKIIQIEKEVV